MEPIKRELFYHRFISIVEEMVSTLKRTAFSNKIKEGTALSCGIYNAEGKMITSLSPRPLYLGIGELVVKAMRENIANMLEDDIYIMNDPFKGGISLSNVTLVSPLFLDSYKKPQFYIVTVATHSGADKNIASGITISKSIIEEGILIEPTKLIEAGKPNKDFIEKLFSRSVDLKKRKGDLNAQILTNNVGIKGIKTLIKRYRLKTIQEASRELIKYSERIMRKTISDIPDGKYNFTDYIDSDGLENLKLKIKVSITIDKDEVIIDFSKSNESVRGPLNAVLSVTRAAVFYVFRTLSLDYTPLNYGCMIPIKIIAKKHSILNASYPASVKGGSTETVQRTVDVLLGALSKAIPDIIPAASQGTMNNVTISGFDSTKNSRFSFYETISGGVGAAKDYDAPDGLQTHMMSTLNESIEEIEREYPIRIKRYHIRRKSGGTGLFKGGRGIVKEYEILTNANVTIVADRHKRPPYGLYGGKSGKRGFLIKVIGEKREELPEKCSFKVKAGDSIIVKTPGGGGWGTEE